MDFTFSDEQRAVEESAAAVFDGMVNPERVREVEATDERFDRELWAALARADLLGLAVPERDGGGGYGMVELSLLLEAQGRCVAPVPLWSTLVLGALPIGRFGSDRLRAATLPKVAAGELVLTAALADLAADIAVGGDGAPTVAGRHDGDGLVLTGTAHQVPYAHVAGRVLVPVATPSGTVVAAIDPTSAGATVERAVTTNREVHPHLYLEGVQVGADDLLAGGDGGAAAAVVPWMLERAWTGLCALQVGVTEAAVAQAAAYLNVREQFGRPLSTFQGTMLKAADAAIDVEAIRVTLWQAAWRLDHELEASRAVAVASWFASEAGQRVVFATQHLHGGIGADIDYPIHRYFFWGKQLELELGSASAHLARLGGQVVGALRSGGAVLA